MPAPQAPFIRFMNGYDENTETGCWIWKGHKYRNGYGAIKVFGKMCLAHRLAYELYKGPIGDGLEILHSCDVKDCVNPDHLSTGTHQQNMEEAADRGRVKSGSDHHNYGMKVKRPKQANPVIVLGLHYESQKEAERALGLGSGTVRYWIKHAPHKAALLRKEYK